MNKMNDIERLRWTRKRIEDGNESIFEGESRRDDGKRIKNRNE